MEPRFASSLLAAILAIVAIPGCKQTDDASEDHVDHLRQEMAASATAFRDTMCACKDAACAAPIDLRYRHWLDGMQAKIDDSNQRNGDVAKITEASQQELDALFEAYDECKARFDAGRGSGSAQAPSP